MFIVFGIMHFQKYHSQLLLQYFKLVHFFNLKQVLSFTLKLVQKLVEFELHAFKVIKIYLVLIIILLFNLYLYFEFHHIHHLLALNDSNYLHYFLLFHIIKIFIILLLILNHHHK